VGDPHDGSLLTKRVRLEPGALPVRVLWVCRRYVEEEKGQTADSPVTRTASRSTPPSPVPRPGAVSGGL